MDANEVLRIEYAVFILQEFGSSVHLAARGQGGKLCSVPGQQCR